MGGIQDRLLQHINPLLTFVNVDSGNRKGVKRKTRVLRFTPLSSIPERFAPSVGAVYAALQSLTGKPVILRSFCLSVFG
jgi:hypothetical protein